jgi:hypothetical protein
LAQVTVKSSQLLGILTLEGVCRNAVATDAISIFYLSAQPITGADLVITTSGFVRRSR